MGLFDRLFKKTPKTPKTFLELKERLKEKLSAQNDPAAGLDSLSLSAENLVIRAKVHGASLLYAACLGAEQAASEMPVSVDREMSEQKRVLIFLETVFYFTHFLERLVFSHLEPMIAQRFMKELAKEIVDSFRESALPMSGIEEEKLATVFDERLASYAGFQEKWMQNAGLYFGQCLSALWPLHEDPTTLATIRQFTQKTALRYLESTESFDRALKGNGGFSP